MLCACVAVAADAEGRGLRTEPIVFDFAAGDGSGWSAPSGTIEAVPGAVTLTVADRTSCLVSPEGLAFDASVLPKVEVEISVEPSGAGATLYWTDDASRGFVPEWKEKIGEERTVLDLSLHPYWRGEVDRLLIVPEPGVIRITLRHLEVRGSRGFAERTSDGWRAFWRTEFRAAYSVNGMIGPFAGPVPFTLLVGVLFVALPLLLSLRKGKRFPAEARRTLPLWIAAGALLLFVRSGFDQVRIIDQERRVLSGRSLEEKVAAVNPAGFYPLLLEASRRIPRDGTVELRATKPFPWEKGSFYLYPRRISPEGDYVVSYQSPAPADSASLRLLFRRPGIGSIYQREAR